MWSEKSCMCPTIQKFTSILKVTIWGLLRNSIII
jgi:hypothetical protein